ncbi:MAG: hypothetical protein OXC07_06085 [Kistimonas sp.]|nr:hypothetical protein [Kistimonas sp.]
MSRMNVDCHCCYSNFAPSIEKSRKSEESFYLDRRTECVESSKSFMLAPDADGRVRGIQSPKKILLMPVRWLGGCLGSLYGHTVGRAVGYVKSFFERGGNADRALVLAAITRDVEERQQDGRCSGPALDRRVLSGKHELSKLQTEVDLKQKTGQPVSESEMTALRLQAERMMRLAVQAQTEKFYERKAGARARSG